MTDLRSLTYGPLTVQPSREELDAYLAPRRVPGYDESTGFDEQKARLVRRGLAGKVSGVVLGVVCVLIGVVVFLCGLLFLLTGSASAGAWVAAVVGALLAWAGVSWIRSARRQPLDMGLWERRYRLDAFAEANRMTYVFRSDPKHWPGMLATVPRRWGGSYPDVSKLGDVLQGDGIDGQRFMACHLEIARCRDAVTGRDIRFGYFTVVALQVGSKGRQVYLKHRRRPHDSAPDQLEASYGLDDPFTVMWTPGDGGRQEYAAARSMLTEELFALILRVAPGYDLFFSGGWLYLMKEYDWSSIEKKNADPAELRERFEIAAQVGPAFAEAALALARGDVRPLPAPPETEKRRKERLRVEERRRAEEVRLQAQVEKLRKQLEGDSSAG